MSKDHILRSKQNGANSQIHQLIDDYLSPKQQKQRQIRRTLRIRKDAPRVCAILKSRVSSSEEPDKATLMLLALSLNRKFFLSDFLLYYGHDTYMVDASKLLSSWDEFPPDNHEQELLKNYIIAHWAYDLRLLKYLDESFLHITVYGKLEIQ